MIGFVAVRAISFDSPLPEAAAILATVLGPFVEVLNRYALYSRILALHCVNSSDCGGNSFRHS